MAKKKIKSCNQLFDTDAQSEFIFSGHNVNVMAQHL